MGTTEDLADRKTCEMIDEMVETLDKRTTFNRYRALAYFILGETAKAANPRFEFPIEQVSRITDPIDGYATFGKTSRPLDENETSQRSFILAFKAPDCDSSEIPETFERSISKTFESFFESYSESQIEEKRELFHKMADYAFPKKGRSQPGRFRDELPYEKEIRKAQKK